MVMTVNISSLFSEEGIIILPSLTIAKNIGFKIIQKLHLNMNLQYERSVEDGTVHYTADISNLHIDNGNEIKLVKAKHYPGYGKPNVTCASITSSNMPNMPNIGKHFANLSFLCVIDCNLSEISKKDFLSLKGLKGLIIKNTSIESLPADLFDLTPSITYLSLPNNKIKFISQYTLTPLKRLTYADFRGNITINEIYDSTGETAPDGITLCMLQAKIFVQCKPLSEQISTVISYVNCLWEGLLSDFIIKVKEKVFKVHKAVLAANSPVFAAMFNHEMKENLKNEMVIESFASETVKEFLAFVYLRELPKKCFDACDLYAMAQEYQIKELYDQIQWHIFMEVNGDNASKMYKLGVLYNNEIIKRAAFQAIQDSLNRKLPEKLLESPDVLMELFDVKDKLDNILKKIAQI